MWGRPQLMTPNFALDLSEDGICLLCKTAEGWVKEGVVSFETDDIADGLAKLRKRAEDLRGPDFTTKLILPPSQLLYTVISAEEDVAQALADRTPYEADQLSYATALKGGQLQVVAVAKETLVEAEEFVAPYGFNPVGFTAVPDPEQFSGEPMLGGTKAYPDGFIPDREPVLPIQPVSPVEAGEPDPKELPLPDVTEASAPKDQASVEPADAAVNTATQAEASDAAASLATALVEAMPQSDIGLLGDDDTQAPEPAPAGPAKIPGPESGNAAAPQDETARRQPTIHAAILHGTTREVSPPSKARIKTLPPAAVAEQLAKVKADQSLGYASSRGNSRVMGLVLTAILLIFLGIAALLSSFVMPDNAISRWLGLQPDPVENTVSVDRPAPEQFETEVIDTALVAEQGVEDHIFETAFEEVDPLVQSGAPTISDVFETSVTPDDRSTPTSSDPVRFPSLSPDDAEVAYAATGIWQYAQDQNIDQTAPLVLERFNIAALDGALAFESTPMRLSQDGFEEQQLIEFRAPPPAGVTFDMDDRGLVVATPEGAINPDGILVILGQPPVTAIPRPTANSTELEAPQTTATTETARDVAPDDTADVASPAELSSTEGQAPLPTSPDANEVSAQDVSEAEQSATGQDPRLAQFKPRQRPDGLVPAAEEEQQASAPTLPSNRPELAQFKPQQRPVSEQLRAQAEAIERALAQAEIATIEAAEAALAAPTAQAVAQSRRAQQRPANVSAVVARVQPDVAEQTAQARGPVVARASRANPTGSISSTVARAATDNNALALGRVTLVGVFGTSSNRRALVRLPNGRFKKVAIGDRVDGGRVAAIAATSLRYTKGGRTVTLAMPDG